MPAPTMAYTITPQGMFIAVHTKDNPSDEEWNGYCELGRKNRGKFTTSLVVTDGGGPNTVQRGQMNDVLEEMGFKGKVAVVTLNRLVRGIVTAISWFNPNIKAFTTLQIPAALEYLGVPKDQQDLYIGEIKRLRDRIGISSTLT